MAPKNIPHSDRSFLSTSMELSIINGVISLFSQKRDTKTEANVQKVY